MSKSGYLAAMSLVAMAAENARMKLRAEGQAGNPAYFRENKSTRIFHIKGKSVEAVDRKTALKKYSLGHFINP